MLRIKVNGSEVDSSPITVTVYPDPTQIGSPLRVVNDLGLPYGVAFNSHGEMLVVELLHHQVSVFDVREQRIWTFGSCGDRPEQMEYPTGIAVDSADNIYVINIHKLQNFTRHGQLIKCIGQRGTKVGEFDDARRVTIHNNHVHISCDTNNHHIQVFDLYLNFVRSIGSCGSEKREVKSPQDIAFDAIGNIYVAESGHNRVQVMDSTGQFIIIFGQEGKGKLCSTSALHVISVCICLG